MAEIDYSDFSTNPSNPYYLHPNENPFIVLVTPLLNNTNYETWASAMKFALISKNKIMFIDSFTAPSSSSSLYDPWFRCNNMVLSWLQSSISDDIRKSILWYNHASLLWLNLRMRFSRFQIEDIQQTVARFEQGNHDISICNSDHKWKFDVFINYKADDTRKNFVINLCDALSKAGIEIYHETERFRAIENSRLSIVVFSKNYTKSRWCLNELENIMECHTNLGQIVVPVFYDVDPRDVRHEMGDFGKKLRVTAKKMYFGKGEEEKMLSSWRSVLTKAAILPGWDAINYWNEGELVHRIVDDVLRKLNNRLLSIPVFPVGLEFRVQQVIQFIETQSSKVCLIGICGMGGSGKTTTAKAIYNRIHHKFEDTSFIENVREVCEKDDRGVIHLQQQLLSDVLKTKENIDSIAFGKSLIDNRLKGKRALVVLDNVTRSEQLKALFENPKLFGSGSVLIVTTRDLYLFNSLEVDHVFTMTKMDESHSLELFSWHAFRQPSPIEDFIELSMSVVARCGGLPLALEVLGSSLHDMTKGEWQGVLSKLETIPNDQVQEKLRLSYDGLEDDEEKNIFLDICCFFIGKDRANVTEILNSGFCAETGIHVLIERSLVKIDKNNKLGMHDLIRDMGREIVCESSTKEPEKSSRLWFHNDIHDVLTKNAGTKTVEGLVLKWHRTGRVCFSTDSFKEMKKLRLLQLDNVDLTGDYGNLSKELRWVHWQGVAFKYIPDDFHLGNVVVIELKHSNIEQVWNETKVLVNLKVLNLSHSRYLKSTPDFSKLPNLEKLIMKDCPCLSEIHPSIGDLNNILLINLKDCTGLINLPKNIYQLKSLKTLILSGCSKLDKLIKT